MVVEGKVLLLTSRRGGTISRAKKKQQGRKGFSIRSMAPKKSPATYWSSSCSGTSPFPRHQISATEGHQSAWLLLLLLLLYVHQLSTFQDTWVRGNQMASDPQTARNPVRFIAHKSTTATLSNARSFSLLGTVSSISSVSTTSLPDHHQSFVMTPWTIIHLPVSEDLKSVSLQ